MLNGQIGRYEQRIADEEKFADEARSPDLALAHRQVAMLYRGELENFSEITRREIRRRTRQNWVGG